MGWLRSGWKSGRSPDCGSSTNCGSSGCGAPKVGAGVLRDGMGSRSRKLGGGATGAAGCAGGGAAERAGAGGAAGGETGGMAGRGGAAAAGAVGVARETGGAGGAAGWAGAGAAVPGSTPPLAATSDSTLRIADSSARRWREISSGGKGGSNPVNCRIRACRARSYILRRSSPGAPGRDARALRRIASKSAILTPI